MGFVSLGCRLVGQFVQALLYFRTEKLEAHSIPDKSRQRGNDVIYTLENHGIILWAISLQYTQNPFPLHLISYLHSKGVAYIVKLIFCAFQCTNVIKSKKRYAYPYALQNRKCKRKKEMERERERETFFIISYSLAVRSCRGFLYKPKTIIDIPSPMFRRGLF